MLQPYKGSYSVRESKSGQRSVTISIQWHPNMAIDHHVSVGGVRGAADQSYNAVITVATMTIDV